MSVALSFLWLSLSLGQCTRGMYSTVQRRKSVPCVSCIAVVRDEAAQLCIMSFVGGKGTITGWAMALTTMFDDPDRFRGYKGRRSLPSPRGHCTVCAAQRMVGFEHFMHKPLCARSTQLISDEFILQVLPSYHLVSLSPNSSAKSGWIATSQKALLLCLAQEKCTHGVTMMRANLETGQLMPSRGHD